MTTPLDTIRYHSGIAGEEVADMVDSLEQEVSTLLEQVEKLTKELDNVKQVEFPRRVQKVTDALKRKHEKELAALAAQNEKMREFLENSGEHNPYCDVFTLDDEGRHKHCTCGLTEALSLPDPTSPVLNRIKAEGMRMAAILCDNAVEKWEGPWKNAANTLVGAIRAKADELEQSK